MALPRITAVEALEILDSRGRPTLQVTVRLTDGTAADAGVPSGASTGSREAHELRDGDTARYDAAGVLAAVANVAGPIAEALVDRPFADLAELDRALCEADGTPTKSRWGANAIVGVSMAAARAFARSARLELWQFLTGPWLPRLPVPHFNVINGGAHAANALEFQEFMLAPLGAPNFPEAVRAGTEVYARLRRTLIERGLSAGLGDEGGFAPDLAEPEEALALLVQSISDAGYEAGRAGVAIALDPAANGFYRAGSYHIGGQRLNSAELIDYYATLVDDFAIWSIEDGLAEEDWDGWEQLTDRLGTRLQLVGDDIFVTDPETITKAAARRVANAALIKLNQIGTVAQTRDALNVCADSGLAAMVSHRSGETTDHFIADLAVGCGCGQLKSGAPARGERVAKYNRLLQISARHPNLPFGLP